LAPEHPAPAALEDVELAMSELATYGSLHVAGASAGGALAIAAAAAAQRSGVRISSLFAQSPMLDYFDQQTTSYKENAFVSIAPVGWHGSL
jgi:acetyl esterase/lipase